METWNILQKPFEMRYCAWQMISSTKNDSVISRVSLYFYCTKKDLVSKNTATPRANYKH